MLYESFSRTQPERSVELPAYPAGGRLPQRSRTPRTCHACQETELAATFARKPREFIEIFRLTVPARPPSVASQVATTGQALRDSSPDVRLRRKAQWRATVW